MAKQKNEPIIEFVESPLFNNWLIHHKPKKNFILCSPYIKIQTINKLFDNILQSCPDVKVLIRGNEEEFIHSSDIEALHYFLEKKYFDLNNFKRLLNLHMKAYLVDDAQLLICSGNMTQSGMFLFNSQGNAEGGIATRDIDTINKFKSYFQNLWDKGESLDRFYDNIEKEHSIYINAKRNTTDSIPKNKKRNSTHQYLLADFLKNHPIKIKDKIKFAEVPKKGSLSDLITTLQILAKKKDSRSTEILGYEKLGDILRRKYGKCKSKGLQSISAKKTNDKKMGEECVKLAEFLSMVNINKSQKPYNLEITKSGEDFLRGTLQEKFNILHDKLIRNEFFIGLAEYCLETPTKKGRFPLVKKYVHQKIDAGEKTINRIHGICNELLLFKYYYDLENDGEMKSLLAVDKTI